MPYKIVTKKVLNEQIFLMEVEAPLVARRAEPGQFIILRIDEFGERVPFTIADFDREKGTVTVIPSGMLCIAMARAVVRVAEGINPAPLSEEAPITIPTGRL